MKSLTPNRPYLLRAYYDWLMDNQLTPHVVVDAFVKGTQVPQQYVKDGQIVLNIAAGAVGNLQISNEFVEFNARFGGVPQQVLLPMASIIAIYARENGAGTVFDVEDAYLMEDEAESVLSVVDVTDKPKDPTDQPPKRRSHLTVVK
ncbi:ClpXP protease specificity-enhancing factor [Shewanella putrefaciens]|jgi:stringent starvation protein B|uniref:ClpXP protease specificity-enhancing factor n=1 Tax=Shewanella putrefaciens TaxID=24 RepID=A0ABX8X9R4_SHEPU|nr:MULTISPECIES: ClpXP protease specificity-enhancing factor [Shewanella]ABM23520.1 Stringent starvation protein B [Shewanella sp. W3-18-1]AVV85254.1 peptidase ClpXP protease specificity-enhancing factor [Shewanella putrefaciens]MCA1897478.1 ClpXP protease specificity-enhancing factor [Shewanella putrefaciens]MCK7632144.1 ClpXP protease specificity-enhancing factor [Shewanella sp. JNE9-1]MCK7633794.1 ClpXP protease specificity-enhancing factor [Shewanella sp. JNE17]